VLWDNIAMKRISINLSNASTKTRIFLQNHDYRLNKISAIFAGTLILGFSVVLCIKPNQSSTIAMVEVKNSTLPSIGETRKEIPLTGFDLAIPKIDLLLPVIPDVDGRSKNEYLDALKRGVAHFKNTAKPDSASGNIYIFGHSSDWRWNSGEYKTAFKRLPELEVGDEIKIYYQTKEYTYTVALKEVVPADDVKWLESTPENQTYTDDMYPVGSNEKRLVVQSNPK